MGNQSSTAAYQEPYFLPPPPPERPLPPIPPPSARAPASASRSAHKLSKPRTQPRSTAGLLKSSDGSAKGTGFARFSTSGLAHLVTSPFSSPSSPSSPSWAAVNGLPSLSPRPPPLSPSSPGPQSPSVFTFEEAVVAVTGQRDPAAWRPMSCVYPNPSLDLELLQEQQARQREFQQRQRQNKRLYQPFLPDAQTRRPEPRPRPYSSFDFEFYGQGEAGAGAGEGERRERDSQAQQQQKKQRRKSFFRPRSSRRSSEAHDLHDRSDDGGHPRRNSIGSVYSYSAGRHTWDFGSMTYDQVASQHHGGPLSEIWPPADSSRASWNYDMTSYAAKRLLHIVHDGPLDRRLEQASAASESRNSVLSEVTWKSSHPVQPESPTLARANSDLSLYAPVRRTSIMQVPGVATRRNSTSSFVGAGAVSLRPAFRHSHPATAPSLTRQSSFESTGSQVLSMPRALQRADLAVSGSGEPVARVSTPPDDEYKAIGAFKLGSLRITNGSASPLSSPETARIRKAGSDPEEPLRSPVSDTVARTIALAALSANANIENYGETTTASLGSEGTGENQLDQFGPSLVRRSIEMLPAAEPTLEFAYELPAEPVASPTEPPQIDLPEDLFAGFEFSSFTFEEAVSFEPPPRQPASTSVAALQTTSKATAVEDQLFEEEDDHSTSGYSSTEVLDVRVDLSAKPPPKHSRVGVLATHSSARSAQSVGRSDSGLVASPTSESPHKPLSKADSGYSSNVSMRSFKQAASKLMAPVAKAANKLTSDKDSGVSDPRRDSFFIDELKLPGPTIDTTHMGPLRSTPPAVHASIRRKPVPSSASWPPPPHREAPPPPPPPKAPVLSPQTLSRDVLPLSPVSISMTDTSTPAPSESSVPGLLGGSTAPGTKRHTMPAPLQSTQSAPRSDSQPSPKSSPNPLTPVSIRSNHSASALSIGSGAQKPSRLLRFLSFGNSAVDAASTNKGPPAVLVTQIEYDEETDIPPRMSDVNDKHHEHAGLVPSATKRLALKAQISRDTLKTILSVGSVEAPPGSMDVRVDGTIAYGPEDKTLRAPSPSASRRHTLAFAAVAAMLPSKAVTKRRSWLSMAVDLSGKAETEETQAQAQGMQQDQHGVGRSLSEPHEENQTKRGGKSWRRRGGKSTNAEHGPDDDDDDLNVFPSRNPDPGHSSDNDNAFVQDSGHGTHSRSSSIISRTMSLTAQLERTLSMKMVFPRLSRASAADDGFAGPAGGAVRPPISAFSTAWQGRPLSPSLPSPLYHAEAVAQQRRSMTAEAMAAETRPASARVQQIRPAMLRVPPPLRTQSTPPSEAGSRHASRQGSQDSLYSVASAQYYQVTTSRSLAADNDAFSTQGGGTVASPPHAGSAADPAHHPNWEVQTDHDSSGLSSRRRLWQSLDGGQGHPGSTDHRSVDAARNSSMVSSRGPYDGPMGGSGPESYGHPKSVSGDNAHVVGPASHGASQEDPPVLPRALQHRASYDGYSNGPRRGWDGGDGGDRAPPQGHPAQMSNGYTAPSAEQYGSGRWRSGGGGGGGGGGSSTSRDIYQLQQQEAWDYYYQQYARPPPNVRRGSHQRNLSMGSRYGTVPEPQAPFRILHSYNSPAYRGVPIWG